jgi:hypothetical protein
MDDGCEEITEENCRDFDADMAYERWRDDQSEALDESLRELWHRFVKGEHRGYYNGRTDKFVEHSIVFLKFLQEKE